MRFCFMRLYYTPRRCGILVGVGGDGVSLFYEGPRARASFSAAYSIGIDYPERPRRYLQNPLVGNGAAI